MSILCSWAITGIESSTQVERMMHRLTTIDLRELNHELYEWHDANVTATCFALVLILKEIT
ncbi:hypothetical protein ABVN80_15865 [Acinetobacter baumannii]